MKKIYKLERVNRLSAYSAMAMALTAAGGDLNAEIIYTDIEDITIEVDGSYDLDVDGDGNADFHFRGGSTTGTAGTWSFVSVIGSNGSVGTSQNQIVGYPGEFYYYASVILEGDPIGPELSWTIPATSYAVLASNFYGSTYGEFPGEGPSYLGVRFMIGENLHYAWIRLEADIDPSYATIIDMAYENVPETEIPAGMIPTAVQEIPSSMLQVYGFESTVHIYNQGLSNPAVYIYDLAGNLITSDLLSDGNNLIRLQNAAVGNYLVQVRADEGSKTIRIFLN